MSENINLYGVILAGGSGSRLWPLSREMYPKQLLKLNGQNTLFQSTFLRLTEMIPHENIITVTNVKHASDVKVQTSELNKNFTCEADHKVLIEPLGRNTAPAIGLSVQYIEQLMKQEGEDPIIIVVPSDHIVKNQKAFNEAVKKGAKLAQKGFIVTFGIKPDKPDTGYGYISTEKVNEVSEIAETSLKVVEFREKPNFDTAKKYVESGTYYWNGGIFMFKASTMMNELKKFTPEIFENLTNSTLHQTGPTIKFDDYEKMTDISIDYAVMEHSKLITLVPLDCGWNDVGSWEAIFDVSEKNENNNYVVGNVVDIDSKNSIIYGTSKLVSTIGLENTVVVETEDAILVCDKNKTQDVKKVFEKLKKDNDLACITHKTVYRPWGYYTVLVEGEGYKTKEIQVNPQAKLSLQMHYKRSEHWVVLTGQAKVIRDDEVLTLNPGDSVDIPVEAKHSLQNNGNEALKIIEIQKGDYLEEDDIVRFDDIYGRV